MRNFSVAAWAVALLFAPAAGTQGIAPVPHIRVESTKPGHGGTLVRDASIDDARTGWWTAADYPAAALASRRTGMATLDVRVGANDKVVGCQPNPAESVAAFADAACAIVRRGNFVHALSVDGQPAEGQLTVYVTFELGRSDEAAPAAPVEMPASLQAATPAAPDAYTIHTGQMALFPNRSPSVMAYVNADGSVRDCMVDGSTGTDAGDIAICRHVMTIGFAPTGHDVPFKYIILFVAP